VPRHVAIIMDGNGRWAAARGLPRVEGHRRGVEALRKTVRAAIDLGISVLTNFFSFSSENWSRPQTEISRFIVAAAPFYPPMTSSICTKATCACASSASARIWLATSGACSRRPKI